MSTSAGRVLIIPKGDYNAGTTYAMLDMVYYNGSSYVCKQPSTGNLPTNTTYWQPMTGDISGKMDKANPTGTGSFSLNRKANTTVGSYSFAEGCNTTASDSFSHAEGDSTTASGMYSHAEGTSTMASAMAAHAEGESTHATGSYSHAENTMTQASGYASHSEGDHTLASGDNSHAEGFYTQAGHDNQHVSGLYNDNKATTLMEVGNGESTFNRSNAFEVYSDGSLSTDNGTTKVKLETLVSQNQALTNYVTETGVKNVGFIKTGTNTMNGVTWTVDENGVVDIDGAATAWSSRGDNVDRTLFKLKAGDYIVTSGNTLPTNTYLTVKKSDGTTLVNINPNASQDTFTLAEDAEVYMYIGTSNSATMSHIKFYPMIRDASITDPTYQPYAKTNVELTQELPQIESGTTAFTNGNEKVNFSKAFNTAPNVIAIPKYTTVTTGETPLLLKVYDVTTTYFRVRAIDNTGANVSSFTNATSFMWQAMT